MKKKIAVLAAGAVILFTAATVFAGKPDNPPGQEKVSCSTIKDGTIEYGRVGDPNTEIIPIGYDQWGYNYQAHMFNGLYWNNQRPEPPYTIDTAPSKTWLIMKWSDEWLSNKDCDNDEKLDRGYSCDPENASSSACQGAWVTNHQFGSYEGEDGKTCKWNYFVKIVMVPEDAYKEDGMWYTADGEEIGSVVWGAYARILQIYNDPCAGETGVENKFETPAGFGFYK